jgi:hypothetical protein
MPRMLRSAISAFTRVFDALGGALLIRGPCSAIGIHGSRLCGAAFHAAPRPGHELTDRRAAVDHHGLAGHEVAGRRAQKHRSTRDLVGDADAQ